MDVTDVDRWFEAYLADFIALGRGDLDDPSRILDHYGVPLLVATDGGTTALVDEEQVLDLARGQVAGMRAAGYDRSERLAGVTTVLNGSCATHRGHFARRRADGGEIGRVDVTYLITDGAAGRRISAIVLHT